MYVITYPKVAPDRFLGFSLSSGDLALLKGLTLGLTLEGKGRFCPGFHIFSTLYLKNKKKGIRRSSSIYIKKSTKTYKEDKKTLYLPIESIPKSGSKQSSILTFLVDNDGINSFERALEWY